MKTSVVLSSYRKFLNNFRLLSTVNSRKSFRFQKIFCFQSSEKYRKNLLFFFVENHRKKLLFFSSKFSNVFFPFLHRFFCQKSPKKFCFRTFSEALLKIFIFSPPKNFRFSIPKTPEKIMVFIN